jgi:hypothetical protein
LIRYIQSRCPNFGPFTIDRLPDPDPILGYVDGFVLLAMGVSDLQCLLSADWCDVFNLDMVVNCAKMWLMVFAELGRHARGTLIQHRRRSVQTFMWQEDIEGVARFVTQVLGAT